MEFHALTEMAV